MFDFKNYVMKIISKSRSPHVVRLQGKLKLFACQPISVANLRCRVNHVKPIITSYLQNLCFSFNFALGEGEEEL